MDKIMAEFTQALQVFRFFPKNADICEVMDFCHLKLAAAFAGVIAPLNDLLSPHEPVLAFQVLKISFICSVVPMRPHFTPLGKRLAIELKGNHIRPSFRRMSRYV